MQRCLLINTQKPEIDYQENAIGIDTGYLQFTKDKVYSELDAIALKIGVTFPDEARTVIGFYVQACLEQCLLRIIQKYQIKNAFLSGGCFLNVKLNKVILDNITGQICVNPLCGDQGAAIGMFRKYTSTKFNFADLCFGKRDKRAFKEEELLGLHNENIFVVESNGAFIRGVSQFISTDNIVNIMQGDMEFGPRALCNTSTLALPTMENTMYINKVNNRNEVMPMAPVMNKHSAWHLLKQQDLDRVIGSNKFMIITHDYKSSILRNCRGILHNKPIESGYTCRPQLIDFDSINIMSILDIVQSHCLINTSFNTHGNPILYTVDDAIEDFRKQRLNDSEDRLILIILNT
jgi:carbamoyltransferase